MNRGDQREVIFRDDEDRQKFLSMLASGLSNSASKGLAADGDGLGRPEPNPDRAVVGEALEGLPGSKSVARVAAAARNQGDPAGSRPH